MSSAETDTPQKVSRTHALQIKRALAIKNLIRDFDGLSDSFLIRKPVVKGVLGDPSDVKFWRLRRDGVIPEPYMKLGSVPLWTVGQIRQVIRSLSVAAEGM
jgi:hypothetical protein